MKRAAAAEFLGALLLTASVVGSGVMAESLSAGNPAVALLGNTLATVAVLAVLIATFAPVSGAHFNPAVTWAAHWREGGSVTRAIVYPLAQVVGCCSGAVLANLMFELPAVNLSAHGRAGAGQWLGEFVASAGLILVVFTSPTAREATWRIPAWIAGAYWFTSSTSFANPAITLARSLSDTFAGIDPRDVPGFVLAQLAGTAAGLFLLKLFDQRGSPRIAGA